MRKKTWKTGAFWLAAFCGVAGAWENAGANDETALSETTQVVETKTVSLRDELAADVYEDSDVFALADMLAADEIRLSEARLRWLSILRDKKRHEFKDVELFKNYVVSLMLEEKAIALVADDESNWSAVFERTARPFVCVWGRGATRRNFDKFANLYLSDEVDYSFVETDLRYPVVIACDPAGESWSVWIEAPGQGTDNTDLNFYNMTEELFDCKYDSEKKARHIAYLKRQAQDEAAREFSIAKKAERSARSAARNADRVSRQNAVIQGTIATQRALGK